MNTTTSFLATALAAIVMSGSAQAAVFYEDLDPLTAPNAVNGLIVNTVDGVAATGDASRALVGEVVLTGGARFVGFNPGDMAVPAALAGQDFTFTMDYFVPQGTTLDALPDGSSPDLFWLQISFDGGNNGSAGFVGGGAAGSGWNTITLTGTLPATIGTINPLFVLADGGFGAGTPNGTGSGTAVYVDNFVLDIVPEPASLSLLGLGGLCVLRRRR